MSYETGFSSGTVLNVDPSTTTDVFDFDYADTKTNSGGASNPRARYGVGFDEGRAEAGVTSSGFGQGGGLVDIGRRFRVDGDPNGKDIEIALEAIFEGILEVNGNADATMVMAGYVVEEGTTSFPKLTSGNLTDNIVYVNKTISLTNTGNPAVFNDRVLNNGENGNPARLTVPNPSQGDEYRVGVELKAASQAEYVLGVGRSDAISDGKNAFEGELYLASAKLSFE